MKKAILFLLFFGLLSCQKKGDAPKEEKCAPVKEKKLEMYQMSEMAALMEQMYVDNLRLKKRILKGEPVGEFPDYFLKILQNSLMNRIMMLFLKKMLHFILWLKN